MKCGNSGLSGLSGIIRGSYSERVLGYGPIAYWPLWEAGGLVANCLVNPAQNGTYVGVTLGQPGIGDGNTCPYFDGINDSVDIFSATLSGAFDSDVGSVAIWCRVFNAAVWEDAAARRAIILKHDWTSYISLHKEVGGAGFDFRYQSPGNERNVYYDEDDVDWFHSVLTWDRLANEIEAFINGAQYGLTQNGMAVWAGAMVDAGIGSRVVHPTDVWYGWLAHAQVYDYVLPLSTIADLAVA